MNFKGRLITLLLAVLLLVTFALPAAAAEHTLYGLGFVTSEGLRLRSEPNLSAATLDNAHVGDCVVLVSKVGDWFQVKYNLQDGYMHSAYLDAATKENAELGFGSIRGSGVNLRTGPSTAHAVAAVGSQGDKCYIIGLNEGWFKVLYQDNTCYIRSDFLELTEIPYENQDSANSPKYFRKGVAIGTIPSAPSSPSAISVSGSQILAEAQKYLGTRYVYGGASPNGFDCSGYVYYVLKQFGFAPGRTPAQLWNQGASVDKPNLQIGDIVFFSNTSGRSITHVGIYSGGGQFIHAPNSRSTVSYSDLTSGYWANTYYGARRMG